MSGLKSTEQEDVIMGKKHQLVIEHVDNGFIIRLDKRTMIAQNRQKVAEFLGYLFMIELMSEMDNMWKFEITAE